VNQGIAIDPGTPMRRTDARAAYAARTAQIHATLARLQQRADDRCGHVGELRRVAQALDDLRAIFGARPSPKRKRPTETCWAWKGGGGVVTKHNPDSERDSNAWGLRAENRSSDRRSCPIAMAAARPACPIF